MYLDCDTTPFLPSKYLARCSVKRAIKIALETLDCVNEGQIGIYDNYLGSGFRGYCIKYPGKEPYFEKPEGDDCH